jgi:MoxR-like ATPase
MSNRPLAVPEVARLSQDILTEVGTVVVGMRSALRTALAAILAGGHVLFEDVSGLGKTLAARSLATALGPQFRRLQGTPDLLPADITWSFVYDPANCRFVSGPARFSPASFWLTRSTGRRPNPVGRFSRPWRSGR